MGDHDAASGELAELRRRAFRPDGAPLTPQEAARYDELRRGRRTASASDAEPVSAPVAATTLDDPAEGHEGDRPRRPTPSFRRKVLAAVGAAALAAAIVAAVAISIWPATARPDLVLHDSAVVGANDVTDLRDARVFDLGGAEAVVGANETGERCVELRVNEESAGPEFVANSGYQACSPPPFAPVLTVPADMSWVLEAAGDSVRILDRPAGTFVTLWPAGTAMDVFFQRDPRSGGGEGS